MYSNPILTALKKRSLGPACLPEDAVSISSHGSAQTSLPSSVMIKPGDKEYGQLRASGNKPNWWKHSSDPSLRQPEGSHQLTQGNTKERAFQSVEEWLWDARSGEQTPNKEPAVNTKGSEKDVPIFDISKVDYAMAKTFGTKVPSRKSSNSSFWVSKDSSKDEEAVKQQQPLTIKTRELPRNELKEDCPAYSMFEGSGLKELCPAFKNFIENFKTGMAHSIAEESDLIQEESPPPSPTEELSDSLPLEYFLPLIDNVTCELSAESSERFWEYTYACYNSVDLEARQKKEQEDEGCVISFLDSIKSYQTKPSHDTFAIPTSIFEQPPLLEEVTPVERSGEETTALIINTCEDTDSNDGKSSGYVGSEERSRIGTPLSRSSTYKDESEMTFVSTKLYKQALERQKRYISTPVMSPQVSYETLISTLMPHLPPPPCRAVIPLIEEH